MIELYANKNKLTLLKRELITSGSIGVYPVHFEFSSDWDGLTKFVSFRVNKEVVDAHWILEGEICEIPWEAITEPRVQLEIGVVGKIGEEVVLPTKWVSLGVIQEGATSGEEGTKPPTPALWEQELARKGDTLGYTEDGTLGLWSEGKLLSEVPVYEFGHGFSVNGTEVIIDTVSDFSGDNTLPMTAAGVQSSIGNIEALLSTI